MTWQPATLEEYLQRWRLTPASAAYSTPSSHLQPVLHHGERAMLKVARIEEEANGCRLLAWWSGNGAARVLELDGHAAVLEWGGASLVPGSAADDDRATSILCSVAATLHAASDRGFSTRPGGLVPLDAWFRSLFARGGSDGPYADGAAIARRLIARGGHTVVLHGDLHHGNVLDFGARGWLATDPKYLVGNRVFDYTNILCNPDQEFAESRFDRRVDLICRLADIPERELLEWTVAWTALSASWFADDGRSDEEQRVLRIGALARARLGFR